MMALDALLAPHRRSEAAASPPRHTHGASLLYAVRVLSSELSTAALDKSSQSRERGITLDLGFSAFTTDIPPHLADSTAGRFDKLQFTLVDCPGHASLIRTIIGGAQIIDMMVLVIDVVKGIQTQTAECLVIGEITTEHMIVVLNKVDLFPEAVREERVEKVKAKIRKALAPTRFADAPMVAVSATGGASAGATDGAAAAEATKGTEVRPIIAPLVDQLMSMVQVPERSEKGPFYFAIDHCFPIKGQGTVITGTVLNGSVAPNQMVELPELRQTVKVKSMQMFHKPVQRAVQGDRLGICVAGLDAKAVERGAAAAPGTVPSLSNVIALVKKVRFFRGECPSQSKFHITVGHTTVMATAIFFGAKELAGSAGAGSGVAAGSATAKAPAPAAAAPPAPPASAGDSAAAGGAGGADGSSESPAGSGASSSLSHWSTRNVPSIDYIPGSEYLWQEALWSPARRKKAKPSKPGKPSKDEKAGAAGKARSKGKAAAGGAGGDVAGSAEAAAADDLSEWQWVWLHFEHEVLCPLGSLIIGSRLDTDIHENTCRLAFYGRLVHAQGPDEVEAAKSLRLYKPKERRGVVDRVMDDGITVIGKSLFKKSTDLSVFIGLKLHTDHPGVVGTIDSAFGKSGKFKASFMGAEGTKPLSPGSPLYLRHRKYVFSHASKMEQVADEYRP